VSNPPGDYTSDDYNAENRQKYERWVEEDTIIMVATTAFSAGISYDRVAMVINYHMVNSMIDFIQKSGRAGGDGQFARSITLVNDHMWA
jgi:ATP-dependent DNA helicase RecQ